MPGAVADWFLDTFNPFFLKINQFFFEGQYLTISEFQQFA